MSTIEGLAADAILEKRKRITIGSSTYKAAKPCVSTLILVSECISELPVMRWTSKEDEIVTEVLRNAKDMKVLGSIAALLIIGPPKGIFDKMIYRYRGKALAEKILNNVSPSALKDIIFTQLETLEIGAFFGLTTSLSEVNLLKPTREVVETTASGL